HCPPASPSACAARPLWPGSTAPPPPGWTRPGSCRRATRLLGAECHTSGWFGVPCALPEPPPRPRPLLLATGRDLLEGEPTQQRRPPHRPPHPPRPLAGRQVVAAVHLGAPARPRVPRLDSQRPVRRGQGEQPLGPGACGGEVVLARQRQVGPPPGPPPHPVHG